MPFSLQGIFPTQISSPGLPHIVDRCFTPEPTGKSDRKIWTWQGLEQVTREGMGQRVMGRRSDGLHRRRGAETWEVGDVGVWGCGTRDWGGGGQGRTEAVRQGEAEGSALEGGGA